MALIKLAGGYLANRVRHVGPVAVWVPRGHVMKCRKKEEKIGERTAIPNCYLGEGRAGLVEDFFSARDDDSELHCEDSEDACYVDTVETPRLVRDERFGPFGMRIAETQRTIGATF
jgi:hypothetical protein